MGTDDGFVGAILADPSDETARLVYADWLDERGDPRGEFLRLGTEWNRRWAGGTQPAAFLNSRMEELQTQIDAEWVAVLDTLGVPPEPAKLWFECFGQIDPPLTRSLVTRRVWGARGQLAGLATFASQFRSVTFPDNALTADLRLLANLIRLDLGTCYYGANDFTIYPFLAELPSGGGNPGPSDILTGLNARDFRGAESGESDEDFITTDIGRQYFFCPEEVAKLDGPHAVLSRYVVAGRLWYVLLRTRHTEYADLAVHFAVGVSPCGKRLMGLLAGGYWG